MDTYRYPMTSTNPFERAREFSSITTDRKAMKVFLSIASSDTPKTMSQLLEETGIGDGEMSGIIGKLESIGFIRRNPSPASQKFALALNGQLFAEQLKVSFPQTRSLFGERILIKELSE